MAVNMNLVYLRGKNAKILKECGFHRKYELYFRRLTRYDGLEWLDDPKVLGEVYKNDRFLVHMHNRYTPSFYQDVAKGLNLKIVMKGTMGPQLYYYQGKYRTAKELFGRNNGKQ